MNNMMQKNILIVDDEKGVREFVSAVLKQEGYHTVTAQTGKEAVEKLKEGYFDVAFVDIMMPDITGVQVLQSIKKNSSETVVVMMTGFASVETAIESLKSGAFDYITKPFELDYLRETVKKAIKRLSITKNFRIIDYNRKQHRQGFETLHFGSV